jgi:ATP-dependent protease ClpP protease subunit
LSTDIPELFFESGVHLPTATLYFGGKGDVDHDVSDASTEQLFKGLYHLAMNEHDITIIFNNGGGDVYNGLALADAVAHCPTQITGIAYGKVMSAAVDIFQACDVRVMAPRAVMMIHYGTDSMSGSPRDRLPWQSESDRLDRQTEDLLLTRIKQKKPRFTRRQVKALLDRDTILTARQAVDLGLADKVLGEGGE